MSLRFRPRPVHHDSTFSIDRVLKPSSTFSIDDALNQQSGAPSFSIDEALDKGAPPPVSVAPPQSTPAAPVAPPKRGRGIGEALDQVGQVLNRGVRAITGGTEAEQNDPLSRSLAAVYGEDRAAAPLQRPAETPMTPGQSRAEANRLIRGAAAPVSSAVGSAATFDPRRNRVVTQSEFDNSETQRIRRQEATEKQNFTPEHWADVSKRGIELAQQQFRDGKNDEAQETLRQAYVAERLSKSADVADKTPAIVLSNLLWFADPYANRRRTMAEAAAPGMTFSPEEQRRELNINRPAAPERAFDVEKDVAAPLVGQLPTFVAGGALGRTAAGVAGGALERAGLSRIGQALGRAAEAAPEALVSPASAGRAMRTLGDVGTRIADEVATLKLNLPGMVRRGVTEGQIIGAITQYSQARQQGATPEEALAGIADAVPLNIGMGVGAEVGLGALGRALGIGYDPIGRVAGDLYEGARRRILPERPADLRGTRDVGRFAAETPLGPEGPPREPALRQLGEGLETLRNQRENPENPENLIVPGGSFRPRGEEAPAEPNIPLRTAADVARERAGLPPEQPQPRPSEAADANVQLARQQEAQRAQQAQLQADLNSPEMRLEQAAQLRPTERQGPLTLGQTIARAGRDADAGEPLAVEYKQAINGYVDAASKVADAKEPTTQLQVQLARAKSALDAARKRYGQQLGASAVLALAANSDDLTEDEKKLVGLGGLAILSTAVTHEGGEPAPERFGPSFRSRLRTFVSDELPGAWEEPRPASDWIGKLSQSRTIQRTGKAEFGLIKGALDEAARTKQKLGRADVLALIDRHAPQIERVVLGGDHGATPSNEVVDLSDVDLTDRHQVEHAIETRRDRIQEIEREVEAEQNSARENMDYAQEKVDREREYLEERVSNAGIPHHALGPAFEYIHDHVEPDYVPARVIDRAMDLIRDDLVSEATPEETLKYHDYEIKERERPGRRLTFTDPQTGESRTEELSLDPGETDEHARRWVQDNFGVAAAREALIEDGPSETEYVVYQRYSGQDHEVASGPDRDEVMERAIDDNALYPEGMESIYDDVHSNLYDYAHAYANWREAESDHYYKTEQPNEAFENLYNESDKLADEVRELERARETAGTRAPQRPDEENPAPQPSGPAVYSSYQRIGGGTKYREILNVYANHPGETYPGGHYSEHPNTAAHLRVEEHRVLNLPDVNGEQVIFHKGEPEDVRTTKAHIVEKRKNREAVLREMEKVVHEWESLTDPKSERGYELARRYQQLNNEAANHSTRETQLMRQLAEKQNIAGEDIGETRVNVMLESQSDWAQKAAKFGIVDKNAREKIAENNRTMKTLGDEREALNIQWRNEGAERMKVLDRVRAEMDATRYGSPEFEQLHARYTQVLDEMHAAEMKVREKIRLIDDRLNALRHDNYVLSEGAPDSPFVQTADAAYLNAAAHLRDTVEQGYDDLAWSTAANRMKNAGLPMGAAIAQYDQYTPNAMRRIFNWLGFKDVKIDRLFIGGQSHWHIRLTPEMKSAIKKGVPILGALALASAPSDAEAQTGDGKAAPNPYATLAGGVAAGAALMAIAGSRSLRRLLAENKSLREALALDDLTGLASKKAFMAAKSSVDHDDAFVWVTGDGRKFKSVNDTHGHGAGDKALAHFGKTIRDVSEEMKIPLRAFRPGGDEFAVAVPPERAAEFIQKVQERSAFSVGKGDKAVTTQLDLAQGKTFEAADAALNDLKEQNRQANPELRRVDGVPRLPEKPEPKLPAAAPKMSDPTGAIVYANPIGPALRELRRYPSAALLAGAGTLMLESDDEQIRNTAVPVMALAALSAIGTRRLAAGKDALGSALIEQLRKSGAGTGVARFFNPEALLAPEARAAIRDFENAQSAGRAKAAELGARSERLGPSGDRAVSDALEGEMWEDTNQFSGKQLNDVLTVAAGIEKEYQAAAAALVQSGARKPEELLADYAGPRRYAYYEAQKAQEEGGPGRTASENPRISATKHRTLDEPIRDAQRQLRAAQASGDATAIEEARNALDEAKAVQMSRRVELGEIREQSYRVTEAIERAHSDVAAARLFSALKDIPGVIHPEWQRAADNLEAAKQLFAAAKNPADRDAATQLKNEAIVELEKITRRFKRSGGDFAVLPDSRSMGVLRGAVVQRDVAHSLTGFSNAGLYHKLLRAWKEVKTVFNPGTHIGNVLSNITFAHMEGLPMWEQPVYLKRAADDLKKYGPAAQALAEGGILDVNAVNAEGEGEVTARGRRTRESLERLARTTRPETEQVLRQEGITEEAAQARRRRRIAGATAAGAALGAAKLGDDEDPENYALGAAAGGLAGALVGARGAAGKNRAREWYSNEDNIFRAAIWLKKVKDGMSPAQATQETRKALGDFRTRSPALRVLRSSVAPFVLYPAKALPRLAGQVVDNPWRWMTLMALWGGLDMASKAAVGGVEQRDIPLEQRRIGGYALPGFTQLPFANDRGEKAAVDLARWTPMSAITTGAPPGSLPVGAAGGGRVPDVVRPQGPVIDLASRFGVNVDPFRQEPFLQRDNPPGKNLSRLGSALAGTALPSMLDFQMDRLHEDIRNRDMDKFKNDLLGPTGLRPRYVRPGANLLDSRNVLENSLREFKQQYRRAVRNNQNPDRSKALLDGYIQQIQQATQNFYRRTGMMPPTDLMRDALAADDQGPAIQP